MLLDIDQISLSSAPAPNIAVVIPCYHVGDSVFDVIARIGPEVGHIIAVDDCCPDGTADRLAERASDPRLIILRHEPSALIRIQLSTPRKSPKILER